MKVAKFVLKLKNDKKNRLYTLFGFIHGETDHGYAVSNSSIAAPCIIAKEDIHSVEILEREIVNE